MVQKRAHVFLPEGLLRDIDQLFGKGKRSAFLTEIVEREVRKQKLLRALDDAAGCWKTEDHPEFEKRLRRVCKGAAGRIGRPPAERQLMTQFLLDTTFIIDVLNGKRNRASVMKELIAEQHELACCAINVAEIYAGMRPPEKDKTEALLRSLEYVPISWEASRLAGHLKQEWMGKGKTLSLADLIIAAVCMTEALTLITDNRKDFEMDTISPRWLVHNSWQ